jgi:1-aminocyclopropane-1-carboxylate synthase
MPELSHRGQRLVDAPPLPEYVAEHFARVGRRWDAETCPDGYINLCIAENKRQNAALLELLGRYEAPVSALGYDFMTGNPEFRARLARFLGRTFLGRTFTTDQIAVLAGAGSVLELLFYVLCNPGDGVLIPTPSYAGFWSDLETRDALRVVTADCSSSDGFRLTPDILDRAIASAECPVTAMLFTNPGNPLGQVRSRDEVRAVVEWAERRQIHLVADEIFALSVFGDTAFPSVASLRDTLGDAVHLVWSFSKDFGASGLRCGVLVSENTQVMQAVGGLAYWAVCSGHTQHLLSGFIDDDAAVDAYLGEMRAGLADAYQRVTAGLEAIGVSYVPADAAFFLVCDLRPHLDSPSWEAEHALWSRLLQRANVNLTPGRACRINEPGFFRLCYASDSVAAVEKAIGRLGHHLNIR